MPGYDGTGPNGQGSLTGRGMGPCGAGAGRGFGRGMGRGRGFGRGFAPGYNPQETQTPEQQRAYLEQGLANLDAARESVQKRLDALKE